MKTPAFWGPFRRWGTFVCLALLWPAVASQADEPPDLPHIQLVLFTPSDVEPPPGHQERLTELVDYTEAFLVHWMKHWKYLPKRSNIFDREADGKVVIRYVRGKNAAAGGQYDRPGFMTEVYKTAIPKYEIPRHLHVWWVHVYLGPNRMYTDYRGSGDAAKGGSAIVRYSAAPGRIDLRRDILDGFHQEYHLKGVVHELGHAFGLPHFGPQMRDGFGTTLMGPNQFEWNKVVKRPESRGYLSEAAAAMLWKHPLFSGSTENRQRLPEVQVNDLRFAFDRSSKRMRVNGNVRADLGVHSVIVVDDSTAAPSEYWRKSYVGRIAEDGSFQVDVTEPAPADGTLKLVFCFDNGAITGDGKTRGLRGAIERTYQYRDRTIVFPE